MIDSTKYKEIIDEQFIKDNLNKPTKKERKGFYGKEVDKIDKNKGYINFYLKQINSIFDKSQVTDMQLKSYKSY